MTFIHELRTEIPVYCRKHGRGRAIMVIDYGYNINTVWVVRLKGGVLKHFLSEDIRVVGNPMNGEGEDLDIPDNWR